MKYNAKMWFLGMGVALVTLAAIPPAEARSTTGWNAFRVWGPLGADQCVAESFGAAVCRCNFNINLTVEWGLITQGGNMSQFGTRLASMGHSRAGP